MSTTSTSENFITFKMSESLSSSVLVTGFGPFGDHKVNISWEVAKAVKDLNLETIGVKIILHEIPVAYSTVSKEVPLLWKKHKPKLVVHLGVTGSGTEINLETVAHKKGYVRPDIHGKVPKNGSAVGEKDVIQTGLDIQDVADVITNSTETDVPISVSTNAGRYLCEFIYYTSMNIDHSQTVFVHIPDFNKGYSVKQLALVVKSVILILLKQLLLIKSVEGSEQSQVMNNQL